MFIFVSYCSDVFWPQFLVIFMEFLSFSICAVCVNLFGRMYNIEDESNILSHKLQISLQLYLKSGDSVSMRNSPACSSLSPKFQEPLSLIFHCEPHAGQI